MALNWNPTGDRLLVKQDPAPALHPDNGFILPESHRENYRPNTGLVVKVGPGRRYDDGIVYPPDVLEGQRVMHAPAATLTVVQHAGEEHLMMREQDVFLVLDKAD